MQAQSSIHHNHFSLKLFHPYNKFITGCVFSISLNPLVSFAGLFSATFYHRVFSNVSSNGLPKMMHSHIGYICVTFLQCAFSNVSSNCLPERMHNHIGCISLICLCCWSFSFESDRLNLVVQYFDPFASIKKAPSPLLFSFFQLKDILAYFLWIEGQKVKVNSIDILLISKNLIKNVILPRPHLHKME